MIEGIESILMNVCPEMVLTYGDTNSTLAGALASAKLHIPVADLEAGLRSFNRRMPEEINRVLTDHIADVLFRTAAIAVQNLENEGVPTRRIIRTGDVMHDAALQFATRAEAVSLVLQRLQLQSRKYILAALHRGENTHHASRLRAILEGLADLARQMSVVLPLHPRTRKAIERAQIRATVLQRILVLEPVGYLDMTMLEKHARLIAPDSSGVQKEAYFHRVPCVTLRDETEWLETLEGGCNQLVFPTSGEAVGMGMRESLSREHNFLRGVYGDGHRAGHIANTISSWDSSRSPDGPADTSSLVANDAISCSVND